MHESSNWKVLPFIFSFSWLDCCLHMFQQFHSLSVISFCFRFLFRVLPHYERAARTSTGRLRTPSVPILPFALCPFILFLFFLFPPFPLSFLPASGTPPRPCWRAVHTSTALRRIPSFPDYSSSRRGRRCDDWG